MFRTVIIYDSKSETSLSAARQMSLLLAPARHYRCSEFQPEFIQDNDYFVIGGVLGVHAARTEIDAFLKANRELLQEEPLAFFSLGAEPGNEPTAALAKTCGRSGVPAADIAVADGEPDVAALVEFCQNLREIKDKRLAVLPAPELLENIEELLGNQKYCTICTACDGDVRGTVISYTYHQGRLYAFCEGTRKFANILRNDRVCVTVFGPHRGGALAAGLQLFGTAQIQYPGTEGYRRMFSVSRLKYDRIMSLPFLLNGLEIRLERAEFFWSNWRQMGLAPRQVYHFAAD